MENSFDLPVTFRNKELSLPVKMIRSGYGTKFEVEVSGTPVLFEPDEELNYRAIIDTNVPEKERSIDIELLQNIAASLEFLMK